MSTPEFGLNRFDYNSPEAFAHYAQRAEELGFGYAFIPSSPLRRMDCYVLLAAVAQATERIKMGPLLENPVSRDPAIVASAIATIDYLAPQRTIMVYGIGDTAVRLVGRRPARMADLEEATRFTRGLLRGEEIEVGTAQPARLPHARPVPVWIAAGGPRTLRMAGGVADGVFIRVGTHPGNLRIAVDAVRDGAREAGRDPSEVRLGAIFHTALDDDRDVAMRIARSMAAGYYEYSPMLFDQIGMPWNGPDVHELKKRVWPDFHHHPDLEESGDVVSFLPDEAADAFALHGTIDDVREQLERILADFAFDIVVPHPALSAERMGDMLTDAYMTKVSDGLIRRVGVA
jgi:5,10-methylenetetrahydromethanopterin reductase